MDNSAPTIPTPLTKKEVAAALRVSEQTVDRLIREHLLPVVKIGPQIRVLPEAVTALLTPREAA